MQKFYNITTSILIICISLFFNEIQACNVDFQVNNSAYDGTVIFAATSTGTSTPTYSWDLGDGNTSYQSSLVHQYSNSGIFTVCVTLTDYDGCLSTYCEDILVNIQNNDDCNNGINECVFPGDTDYDGSANIYDLFLIGLHYGDQGAPRPDATDAWFPQPCQDWPLSCLNTNLKHSDCNGDGVINNLDMDPIQTNYYNDHSYTSISSSPSAPIVTLEFSSDSFFIDESNPGLVNVSVDINIGTPNAPVSGLYALALSLNFSDDLIDQESITVEYESSSFFCDSENVLFLSKTTSDGMVDVAFSRTNQNTISGNGTIARVNFTIIGDLVVNRGPDENELPLAVETRGLKAINQYGSDLGYASHGGMTTFHIDQSSGLKEDINENLFQIAPNPTTGAIRMEFEANTVQTYKVYNATGQLLMHDEINNVNTIQEIDLSTYPNGTYFIKVSNEKESATKRVVLSR